MRYSRKNVRRLPRASDPSLILYYRIKQGILSRKLVRSSLVRNTIHLKNACLQNKTISTVESKA